MYYFIRMNKNPQNRDPPPRKCEYCKGDMKIVGKLPKIGQFPEIHVFRCNGCNCVHSQETQYKSLLPTDGAANNTPVRYSAASRARLTKIITVYFKLILWHWTLLYSADGNQAASNSLERSARASTLMLAGTVG